MGKKNRELTLLGANDPDLAIVADIESLAGLGVDRLREIWERRFRAPVPTIQSADILRRLIAWKIQVETYGGLDEETKRHLRHLQRLQAKGQSLTPAAPGPKAGTVLVREWRGVEHRVLVLDQGFEHQERRYQSLSEVARAITGTRWSGPRFFGLEVPKGMPTTKARP